MKVSNVTFKLPREPIPDADSNDWMRDGARVEARPVPRARLHLQHAWHSGLVPLGEGRGATQGQQRRWLCSKVWQRRVRRALRRSGLNFSQWLVLDATAALIATTGDAVSQGDVAGYLELPRMAISRAMSALDWKGLVSRGGPMSGPAWRIFMNEKGMNLLRDLADEIEAVSRAC